MKETAIADETQNKQHVEMRGTMRDFATNNRTRPAEFATSQYPRWVPRDIEIAGRSRIGSIDCCRKSRDGHMSSVRDGFSWLAEWQGTGLGLKVFVVNQDPQQTEKIRT